MNSFWHQSPLIRVAVSFVIGICLGNLLPANRHLHSILAGVFIIVIALIFWYKFKRQSHRHRFQFGGILLFGFLVAGALIISSHKQWHSLQGHVPAGKHTWVSEVASSPEPTKKSVKIELAILASVSGSQNFKAENLHVLAYGQKQMGWDTLAPGDQVYFESEITQFAQPINPGQFDYGKYLMNHGISGIVFLNKHTSVIRPENQKFSLKYKLLNIQSFFIDQMGRHGMNSTELGVASALILGKRSLVDKAVKDNFADAGVVHILAVSGLHVGIIYIILIWLLSLVLKKEKWKWLKLGLIILMLWVYAGITGMSPSVMRAATMFSFVAVGREMGKRGSIFNMLGISAILLLVINPFLLFEVGFQLSYAAVIGIAVFFPPIHKLWYIRRVWLDKIWSLLVVSFSAQLATFPLAVYYFDQFPNYFLLSNLLVIPLATIGLYGGLILISFSWVPYVGEWLSNLVEWLFWLLISVVDVLTLLPMAKTEHLHMSEAVLVLTYVFIYFSYKFLQSPTRWRVWWPLSIALVLIGFYAHRKHQVYHTSELVVLEGPKEPVVLIQYGRKAFLYVQDSTQTDFGNYGFHLSGYIGLKGIDQLTVKHRDGLSNNGQIQMSQGRIKFLLGLNENSPFSQYKGMEFLSAKRSTINTEYLTILPPNMSAYQRNRLVEILREKNQPYWDMAQDGIIQIAMD